MSKQTGKIRASIRRWLGVPTSLDDVDFWQQYTQSENNAGQQVDERSLLGLSAVYACSRLISETAATLPLKVYERRDDGRHNVPHHQIGHILGSPNTGSTAAQFWSAMVSSMLLWGNGFAQIMRTGPRIAGLEFLHPSKVSAVRNGEGKITHYQYARGGTRQPLKIDARNMLHIPAFGVDGRWGISAIAYGAPVFGSGIAAANQANSTFKNGLAPTVAIQYPQWVKKDQREEFKKHFREISGAINAGEPVLLEGGMAAQQIGINPKDAQLLESRTFSVEEICRWFGVDPSMIGHGSAVSNWGTGLEQKMIGFLTFTLQPLLARIEQAINKYLIADERYYAEFVIEGLLRADSVGRASLYRAFVDSGIMTRDEVREKENLSRLGGNSGKQTIQMGFTTLESIGKAGEEKINE